MAELGEMKVGFASAELLSRSVREVRFSRTEYVGETSAALEITVSLPPESDPSETTALVDKFLSAQRDQ